MISDTVTGEDRSLDRHKLATAWIYGDVVHHDMKRRQEGDAFGLFERFRGAVPLVAWAMVGTIELLNYIRALHKDGVLQLRQEVLDEPVALESTTWEHSGELFYAPVGTEAPTTASTPPPQDWARLGKATDLSRFRTNLGGQLLHAARSPQALGLPPPRPASAAGPADQIARAPSQPAVEVAVYLHRYVPHPAPICHPTKSPRPPQAGMDRRDPEEPRPAGGEG